MPHARITHPSRPTLEFRQGQRDADTREAVASVAPELATDRNPLVHIQTRNRQRQITGRVTAPRREANDSNTSDWEQALANYVDELEAHCDEFQGFDGYTFTDDIRSESFPVVFESVEWTLAPGAPYEIEYDLNLLIGEGVLESRSLDLREPTVDTSMSVAGRVGGEDLPGLREFQVARTLEFDTNALYGKDSAANNDIVAQEGVQHELVFRGTHTGSDSTRAAADSALESLIGTQVTFETRFPGYDLDGFVLGYDSNLEQRFGTQSHQYVLRFIEGERA